MAVRVNRGEGFGSFLRPARAARVGPTPSTGAETQMHQLLQYRIRHGTYGGMMSAASECGCDAALNEEAPLC
jgi:hypothetical protein